MRFGPVVAALRKNSAPQLDTTAGLAYRCGTMIGPAKIYFIIFGLLTIVGGVIGYVKAGSTASIIAGGISGAALLAAAFLLLGNVVLGLIVAGVVSLLLAGRFIPNFMQTGKIMPAGLMAILSAIGVIVVIVAWIKK
ncbi:MAG TPA: TMEM14 family protein [Chthoniobacterales bacterium]|nr:TMEM14 family protein [Chthoniobacterales bacterium]